MKIIVSFENRVRPDSTGVYFIRAVTKLGHDVIHVLPEHIYKVKPGDADFYLKVDDGLSNQKWNPGLHPSAYYCIDTHIESGWRLDFSDQGEFDIVTVCQSEGLNIPWKAKDVFYLPLACDPSVHNVGEMEKIYDGCFIGNFHTNHASRRVDTVHAFFEAVPKPYFGNRMFQEMAEKYAQSKLVLNQAINGDVGMRVFEAMCSGSCLVTERLPDMDKIGLIDGVHYAGYSSLDELKKMTKELLSDDQKRQAIARNGKIISDQHTYKLRLSSLLEHLPKTQEKNNGLAIR